MTDINPLDRFLDSIKTTATRETYFYALKYYLDYLKLGSYDDLLVGSEKQKEDNIINFIQYLGEIGKSWNTKNTYLNAIKKFYSKNRINLDFAYIADYLGEKNTNQDKPYSKEQIALLLQTDNIRLQVLISLLSCTGIRIAATEQIQIKHLKYDEQNLLYWIKIYAKDTFAQNWDDIKSDYVAFTTPQTAKIIKDYLKLRDKHKKLDNDDYLFVNKQYDDKITHKALSKELAVHVDKKITRIKTNSRTDIMLNHGFRKFFLTQLTLAQVHPMIVKTLTGHTLGVVDSYLLPTPQELLEQYKKAIPYLTIDY